MTEFTPISGPSVGRSSDSQPPCFCLGTVELPASNSLVFAKSPSCLDRSAS